MKTQFGEGSINHAHYNLTNEGLTRVTQLEVEKKELELKLKTAREAMQEYVSLLNEKVGQNSVIKASISLIWL